LNWAPADRKSRAERRREPNWQKWQGPDWLARHPAASGQ
jgi:hypothetical protein